MPVIVGAPRSGTTLLRLMLDAHSKLTIPPETGFLPIGFGRPPDLRRTFFEKVTRFPADAPAWNDYGISTDWFWRELQLIEPFQIGAGFRCFYRLYSGRLGKPRWGDKTPGHIFGMPQIEKRLPEAHFIHLIRDGRDVALSWRPLWFSPSQSLEDLADHWVHWVETGRRFGRQCRHYLEVRYEELAADPRGVLSRICSFIDVDFEEAMLESHLRAAARLDEHGTRQTCGGAVVVTRDQRMQQQARNLKPVSTDHIFGWRREMTGDEQESFWHRAGHLLEQLGYEP